MINTDLFRSTMLKIRQRLESEKALLEKERLSTEAGSKEENIENLLLRASDVSFRLLVMGRFSSGKSALINGLLGEQILPEKALPATALITEIYYGKEKKVVMYPRPGKWKGGNAPFEIEPTKSEIAKYSTLNNKTGINTKEANRIDSCFEKMVVYWPLELLKDGVCIIDSPGTNDPYSNDYIVEAYVPKADAILYCINGTNPYDAVDRNTLEMINSKGFSRPLIVTTYFDIVTDGMDETEIREEFVEPTFKSFYSRHTSRECCHYVNSKLALESKQRGSHADLVASGFYEMEKFLGDYLSEGKGREKLSGLTHAVKLYNESQKKCIQGVIANLDTPLDEFNQKIAQANDNLKQAQLQGELMLREFQVEAKNEKENIKTLVPSLFDKLYQGINLDDFTPDTQFTLWHPKNSSSQIAEECAKEIEFRNKLLIAEWNTNVLTPKLEAAFKNISSKLKKQFDTFSSDINKANVSLGVDAKTANTDVAGGTRVAMFAYALLTGDWITALMGGIFGAGAFGRTLVCQFAAGFVLGIVALFTPIGLPALIIAGLGGLIGGLGWNAARAASSIKKKSVEQTKEKLYADKEQILADVEAQCMKIFDDAQERLQTAIDEDIEEVRKTIETITREKTKSAVGIEARKAALKAVLDFINETDASMDSIRGKFKIS